MRKELIRKQCCPLAIKGMERMSEAVSYYVVLDHKSVVNSERIMLVHLSLHVVRLETKQHRTNHHGLKW